MAENFIYKKACPLNYVIENFRKFSKIHFLNGMYGPRFKTVIFYCTWLVKLQICSYLKYDFNVNRYYEFLRKIVIYFIYFLIIKINKEYGIVKLILSLIIIFIKIRIQFQHKTFSDPIHLSQFSQFFLIKIWLMCKRFKFLNNWSTKRFSFLDCYAKNLQFAGDHLNLYQAEI